MLYARVFVLARRRLVLARYRVVLPSCGLVLHLPFHAEFFGRSRVAECDFVLKYAQRP